MGVPTSEVGYNSAMTRREDHEVHKDMWGTEGGKNSWISNIVGSKAQKGRKTGGLEKGEEWNV